MKQVTQEEFYDFIGNQDAVVSLHGDTSPYTAKWTLRHTGELLGEDYRDENGNRIFKIKE